MKKIPQRLLPAPILIAQGLTNPVLETSAGSDLESAESGSLLFSIINGLLGLVMIIGALLVLVNLILAAIEWIGSGGDSGKLQKARDRIIQAVIGLFVLSATLGVWYLLRDFLGISLSLEPLFP